MLRSVHAGFRVRLRTYDPIIRWGGDEFICLIPGVAVADARGRVAAAREDLAKLDPRVSVSVGFSSLTEADTVTSLVARAEAELFEGRRRDRDDDGAPDGVGVA